ncbi:hypothetical protein [Crocosphaera sp.]|uniref:hypothetical protein n=1 Tax=Crocosphaera sp. TaxID=2729996 RepID=UPI003F29AFAD|nr:hypothetical protein [Crocosphaera sp.]
MRPHRRQFVLGSLSFKPYEDWFCQEIEPNLWISHCPDLRIGWTKDVNGVTWVLLGLAIESLLEKLDPLAEIAQTPTSNVPELYTTWSGRWLLVGNGEIHLDASGLLGCYYGIRDGQMWVSSSPVLLADILELNQASDIDSRFLQYETGISWFTPPLSPFHGIQHLLPSQVLNFRQQTIEPRPLMPTIDKNRSYEELLEAVKTSLMTILRRLSHISPQLWLGLTAGYDSRLMLVLSRMANIEVLTFTRKAGRTSIADLIVPPQLADECGYSHLFKTVGKEDISKKQLLLEHSGHNISQGDAEPFLKGVREGMTGISFGGHGFAIASGFAKLRTLSATFDDPDITAKEIAYLFQESDNSTATEGLKQWLAWVKKYPQKNLDWRDRFYLEQRQGGWLSTKEQVYDLAVLERFPILNCANIYCLLLSIKEEKRLGSLVQEELISQCMPEILKYPFNPDDSYFGIHEIINSKSWQLPAYISYKLTGKFRWVWRSLILSKNIL